MRDDATTEHVARLRAALEYVRAHPERWDQGEWFRRDTTSCGTTMCLAGVGAHLAGYEPAWESDDTAYEVYLAGQLPHNVYDVATALFGLTYAEADELFFDSNTLEDLVELVDRFTASVVEEVSRDHT